MPSLNVDRSLDGGPLTSTTPSLQEMRQPVTYPMQINGPMFTDKTLSNLPSTEKIGIKRSAKPVEELGDGAYWNNADDFSRSPDSSNTGEEIAAIFNQPDAGLSEQTQLQSETTVFDPFESGKGRARTTAKAKSTLTEFGDAIAGQNLGTNADATARPFSDRIEAAIETAETKVSNLGSKTLEEITSIGGKVKTKAEDLVVQGANLLDSHSVEISLARGDVPGALDRVIDKRFDTMTDEQQEGTLAYVHTSGFLESVGAALSGSLKSTWDAINNWADRTLILVTRKIGGALDQLSSAEVARDEPTSDEKSK